MNVLHHNSTNTKQNATGEIVVIILRPLDVIWGHPTMIILLGIPNFSKLLFSTILYRAKPIITVQFSVNNFQLHGAITQLEV